MKTSEQQSKHNANTRSQWEYFSSHRHHTTSNICEARNHILASQIEPTLAVLGAGNGNDLELDTIAKSFSKIHLFDFDPAALEYLKSQQLTAPTVSEAVVIEPPVDLSGVFSDLDNLPSNVTESFVLEFAEKTRKVENVLPNRQFDVVVSTSLTSQLLGSIVESFGDDSQFKNYMLIAIRDGHLKLLEKLTRPGGIGLLILDFVSSDTLPELATADTDESMLATGRKAIDERNFFTGTNPWAIKEAMAKLIVEDPSRPWDIARPWRWRIGDNRYYAVTAIRFSKPLP